MKMTSIPQTKMNLVCSSETFRVFLSMPLNLVCTVSKLFLHICSAIMETKQRSSGSTCVRPTSSSKKTKPQIP